MRSVSNCPDEWCWVDSDMLKDIKDPEILDRLWKICYESKRWEKWVTSDFDPIKEKIQLIKICGHYVLSNEEFINQVKINFPNIDDKIKSHWIDFSQELRGKIILDEGIPFDFAIPYKNEKVIIKNNYDSFFETPLDYFLS